MESMVRWRPILQLMRKNDRLFRPKMEILEGRALPEANHLWLSAPALAAAGDLFPVTVTALDNDSNPVPIYSGTVRFAASDPGATLPPDYTFLPDDQGTQVFRFRLVTSGTSSILAQDLADASIGGNSSVTVVPASLDHFSVSVVPATTAGTPVTVIVTAQDAFGNKIPGYTGTIRWTTPQGQATLPADYTFQATDQGSRSFQIIPKTAGSQTIQVVDTATGRNGSTSFTVSPGALDHFQVLAPASVVSGAWFSATVIAQDQFGNTVDNPPGTIHFSTTEIKPSLPEDHIFTPEDHGTFTTQIRLTTEGVQSLTVTAPGGSSKPVIVGRTDLRVLAGTATTFSITAPSRVDPGQSFPITVIARDSGGNVARGFSGTVHFTSSDGAAVLPPDYTFKENDQATARFQVTFQTGGGQVLTVNDTSHKDLQGQTWITVQPQTFNQKYVQQLYWELLGRPAETSGMNHWANLLDRGTPRAEVVRSIQQSPEFHLRVVTSLYATFLGREPDSVGRDYFTLFMNQGGSVDQAAILILSSTEYYNRIGGGNDRGYLACLYQDILHRPIDPAGDQYFGQLLSSGKPRMEIVRFLRENPAGQQALIQDLYQTYLKRSASTPEINYFFEAYKDGRPSERITSLILSGEEFLARIH